MPLSGRAHLAVLVLERRMLAGSWQPGSPTLRANRCDPVRPDTPRGSSGWWWAWAVGSSASLGKFCLHGDEAVGLRAVGTCRCASREGLKRFCVVWSGRTKMRVVVAAKISWLSCTMRNGWIL